MRHVVGLTAALLAISLSSVSAQTAPILAQQPTLSATEVVFVFAGDLWSVPRTGGDARRLTTGSGVESNPSFSPDGNWIAFTGQYDGNIDVFVVPAQGGVPRRLTWHPDADTALGWTRDGKRVLFSSTRTSYSRFRELFLVGLDGGLEEKLPLPMGFEAAFSPDGDRLAYVPLSRAFSAWKRYRGGQTTPIWIATLSNSHIEKMPRDTSNDFCPMWVDDKVYFLSDRTEPVTLFSYDTKTKKVSQAVPNNGMDFKSASAGPGAIVIEQFGQIQLYDLASGRLTPVKISIAGDIAELRPKYVNVARRLTNAHISPTGARALFEARGEILTVPAEKGDTRNLTSTPGVMERDPAWSPDGQWIAYFSDESGEYELHVRDSMGRNEPRKIRLEEKPTFYLMPRWSPDSKKIAYLDAHLNTWYVDIDERKPVKVDKDRYLFPPPAARARLVARQQVDRVLQAAPELPERDLSVLARGGQEPAAHRRPERRALSGVRQRRQVSLLHGQHRFRSVARGRHPQRGPAPHAQHLLVVLSKNDPSPFAPESDEEKVVKPGRGTREAGATPELTRAERRGRGARKAAGAGATARVPEVRIDWDRDQPANPRDAAAGAPLRRPPGGKAREPLRARGAGPRARRCRRR